MKRAMKKLLTILSWAAFVIVGTTIALTSVYVGAMVCGYLRDTLGLTGAWVLLLVPVLFVVALCVEVFLMLGASKVRLS